jgi:precorrin-3B synthase
MKRGWCPGVHEPMPSGDGLLIRVKPFGGRLSPAMLRTLAKVAAECGNGVIELTGRGNIQLRGLTAATAKRASDALVEAGLADPDPVREARRNVIAVPPCDDALVAAIEALLAETPGLAPKFCVAVGNARADIQVVGGRVIPLSRIAGEGWGEGEALRRLAEAAADPGPLPPGLLLGLPFGQSDAAALLRLAELAGGASLRTTPWRSFFLEGTHDPAPFAEAGFITDPHDPRRTISACAGSPGCASASVPARADAAFLAARGIRGIHVSGCAKGCAHPKPATTLVGSDGRYGFVRHGRAGDRPAITGLTITQAAELLA